MELKASPGGNPFAVNFSGVFAAVTVKLNGWLKNATALNALVMTAGALELPLKLFVGYRRLLGMICFDWSGAIPIQMRLRRAAGLEIFQLDVVTHAALQRDGARPIRRALRSPFVNDQLVVHPQLAAVVRMHVENNKSRNTAAAPGPSSARV